MLCLSIVIAIQVLHRQIIIIIGLPLPFHILSVTSAEYGRLRYQTRMSTGDHRIVRPSQGNGVVEFSDESFQAKARFVASIDMAIDKKLTRSYGDGNVKSKVICEAASERIIDCINPVEVVRADIRELAEALVVKEPEVSTFQSTNMAMRLIRSLKFHQ